MITGNLDTITDEVATGWAWNSAKRSSIVDVSIKVNGEIIANGKTGLPRPDVARKYGRQDTGFNIQIQPEHLNSNKPMIIEAVTDGKPLLGTISLPPNTFFLHIPKTGGSTLRSILEPLFDQHWIFPDAYQMRRHNGLYPPRIKDFIHQSELDRIRLTRGHFGWSQIHLFKERPQVITILRDPVDRMASHLKHIFSLTSPSTDPAVFQEFLHAQANSLIEGRHRNAQCKVIGETDSQPIRGSEAANLDRAISRLSEIDHLFFTNELGDISKQLSNAWGLKLPPIRRMNSSKSQLTVPDNILAKIRKHNEYDIELYKAARSSRSSL